jgi:chromosomal replication initiator protein
LFHRWEWLIAGQFDGKETLVSCLTVQDPQLVRLAGSIAEKVGAERFHVWFNNSTRLDLRNDGLEIAVPNDFISEWIGRNFTRPIQEAVHEVLGCTLAVRFIVVPELFDIKSNGAPLTDGDITKASATMTSMRPVVTPVGSSGSHRPESHRPGSHLPGSSKSVSSKGPANMMRIPVTSVTTSVTNAARPAPVVPPSESAIFSSRPRLRHDLSTFVLGPSNQLAYNTVTYVAEFPGAQYNPLFIHGNCGLGKTHLLQGLCKQFAERQPTKRWMYMTGEEFTNEFLLALRGNKLDAFRRKMRDLDLLVIDDVHFLGGKRATQEEFLHTFNAIEAMGKQVVMASDNHPKLIDDFGESLINRFVSGMVVRVDPPNFGTRVNILQSLCTRMNLSLSEEVVGWIARRVTQNVRELEGAVTRIVAVSKLSGDEPDIKMVQAALGDLDRQMVAPVRPENIMQAVCNYFSLEHKDLMSGRRQRTISLARSVAMYLVRKTAKLSFPEIGNRMGKRNHSTVISACRRIERAVAKNETLNWTSSVGEREEEASELIQRLEEHSRAMT